MAGTSPEAKLVSQRTFSAIVDAYVTGLMKIWASRAAQLTHQLLVLRFRGSLLPHSPAPEGWEHVFSELVAISRHEFESFGYVSDFGHLVFTTTLFDTFLTDATRFIFLLRPDSIGKSQGITVADIIDSDSRADLLRTAVDKRARELSYKSFADRIDFLVKNYGLALDISPETADELEHFSGVRNVMIHDQAFYELGLDEAGGVTYSARSCPCHPQGNRI